MTLSRTGGSNQYEKDKGGEKRRWRLTQRVTAAQLWLLGIFTLQLIPNTIQQLHIALLWVLLQRSDERPAHRSCSLACDVCVLSVDFG